MKIAIGYTRVSTSIQADEGFSLEAQEEKIKAWCAMNGYSLAGVFVDAGISGSDAGNRPGLQKALADCRKGGALVVYSLSRLARSTRDTLTIAEELQRRDVDLVSLSERIDTTSASGKMVFRLLAVLAEFERDQVSERTKGVLQHKKSRGERIGGIPYGSRLADDGVRLLPDETEQEIVALVKKFQGEGLNLQASADRLAAMGYKPRGAKWYPQTIKNILAAA